MAEERRNCGVVMQEMCLTHDRRIGVIEQEIVVLQKDMVEHKTAMNLMVSVLNEIKLEIIGAKSAVKTGVGALSVIMMLLGGLYTIHWLNIPSTTTSQVESSHK